MSKLLQWQNKPGGAQGGEKPLWSSGLAAASTALLSEMVVKDDQNFK